jgi:hypothetical protein
VHFHQISFFMKTCFSFLSVATAALMLSACASLPRMMTSGVAIVTIPKSTPAAVAEAAEQVFSEKGYRRSSAKSANPLTFDKARGALNSNAFPPSVRENGVRVNLWISPIGDTGEIRLEQKAFVLGGGGTVAPFPNIHSDLTLWNMELGSALAEIATRSGR